MKVLIADDSAVIRERLAELLKDLQGVEIVGQAEDARAASDMAKKLRPDVAILDLQMPRGSGVDVLGDIKGSDPTSIVIMLTNFAYPENRKMCIESGADYFFDKSAEFEKVVSLLRLMLHFSSMKPH